MFFIRYLLLCVGERREHCCLLPLSIACRFVIHEYNRRNRSASIATAYSSGTQATKEIETGKEAGQAGRRE
jgi:hypothetical protein